MAGRLTTLLLLLLLAHIWLALGQKKVSLPGQGQKKPLWPGLGPKKASWSTPGKGNAKPPEGPGTLNLEDAKPSSGPTWVYRADMLPPDELRLQKCFFPRGMNGARPNQGPPDMSIWNHVQGTKTGMSNSDSAYVSTTTDLDFARRFLSTSLSGTGWIYKIHVSPNFVDVAGTLGGFYSKSE